jgi:hypothetical protein
MMRIVWPSPGLPLRQRQFLDLQAGYMDPAALARNLAQDRAPKYTQPDADPDARMGAIFLALHCKIERRSGRGQA